MDDAPEDVEYWLAYDAALVSILLVMDDAPEVGNF